jgi:hypothetical protein
VPGARWAVSEGADKMSASEFLKPSLTSRGRDERSWRWFTNAIAHRNWAEDYVASVRRLASVLGASDFP